MDYSTIMALKQLVVGQQQPLTQESYYKGSALVAPSTIGTDGTQKQVAKPFAKVQATLGEKYVARKKQDNNNKGISHENIKDTNNSTAPNTVSHNPTSLPKHLQIWSPQQIPTLPAPLPSDDRKQPQFQILYRQQVATQDLYLGLSGRTPSSMHCQQQLFRIMMPNTTSMRDIQLDLTSKELVVQTQHYYLKQSFQYQVDEKAVKAKWISDKGILELVLKIKREDVYDL